LEFWKVHNAFNSPWESLIKVKSSLEKKTPKSITNSTRDEEKTNEHAKSKCKMTSTADKCN